MLMVSELGVWVLISIANMPRKVNGGLQYRDRCAWMGMRALLRHYATILYKSLRMVSLRAVAVGELDGKVFMIVGLEVGVSQG